MWHDTNHTSRKLYCFMNLTCCNTVFANKKAFGNHERWCSGRIRYKSDTGYSGIHAWVRKRKPKPQFCEQCKIKPPIDLANLSGKYMRDIADYVYLCRSCHKIKDYTKETKMKLSVAARNRDRAERGVFL